MGKRRVCDAAIVAVELLEEVEDGFRGLLAVVLKEVHFRWVV